MWISLNYVPYPCLLLIRTPGSKIWSHLEHFNIFLSENILFLVKNWKMTIVCSQKIPNSNRTQAFYMHGYDTSLTKQDYLAAEKWIRMKEWNTFLFNLSGQGWASIWKIFVKRPFENYFNKILALFFLTTFKYLQHGWHFWGNFLTVKKNNLHIAPTT